MLILEPPLFHNFLDVSIVRNASVEQHMLTIEFFNNISREQAVVAASSSNLLNVTVILQSENGTARVIAEVSIICTIDIGVDFYLHGATNSERQFTSMTSYSAYRGIRSRQKFQAIRTSPYLLLSQKQQNILDGSDPNIPKLPIDPEFCRIQFEQHVAQVLSSDVFIPSTPYGITIQLDCFENFILDSSWNITSHLPFSSQSIGIHTYWDIYFVGCRNGCFDDYTSSSVRPLLDTDGNVTWIISGPQFLNFPFIIASRMMMEDSVIATNDDSEDRTDRELYGGAFAVTYRVSQKGIITTEKADLADGFRLALIDNGYSTIMITGHAFGYSRSLRVVSNLLPLGAGIDIGPTAAAPLILFHHNPQDGETNKTSGAVSGCLENPTTFLVPIRMHTGTARNISGTVVTVMFDSSLFSINSVSINTIDDVTGNTIVESVPLHRGIVRIARISTDPWQPFSVKTLGFLHVGLNVNSEKMQNNDTNSAAGFIRVMLDEVVGSGGEDLLHHFRNEYVTQHVINANGPPDSLLQDSNNATSSYAQVQIGAAHLGQKVIYPASTRQQKQYKPVYFQSELSQFDSLPVYDPMVIGDVNEDGYISSADAQMLLTMLGNSLSRFKYEKLINHDVNSDGTVDIRDCHLMILYTLGAAPLIYNLTFTTPAMPNDNEYLSCLYTAHFSVILPQSVTLVQDSQYLETLGVTGSCLENYNSVFTSSALPVSDSNATNIMASLESNRNLAMFVLVNSTDDTFYSELEGVHSSIFYPELTSGGILNALSLSNTPPKVNFSRQFVHLTASFFHPTANQNISAAVGISVSSFLFQGSGDILSGYVFASSNVVSTQNKSSAEDEHIQDIDGNSRHPSLLNSFNAEDISIDINCSLSLRYFRTTHSSEIDVLYGSNMLRNHIISSVARSDDLGTCRQCPPHHFYEIEQLSCVRARNCSNNEFMTMDVRPFRDRRCQRHAQCEQDSFEIVSPTKTTDRICQLSTRCNSTSEFVFRELTPTSDRSCKQVRLCESGVEYEVMPSTSTSDRICKLITNCDPFSTEVALPTYTSDRQCQLLDFKVNETLQVEISTEGSSSQAFSGGIVPNNIDQHNSTSRLTSMFLLQREGLVRAMVTENLKSERTFTASLHRPVMFTATVLTVELNPTSRAIRVLYVVRGALSESECVPSTATIIASLGDENLSNISNPEYFTSCTTNRTSGSCILSLYVQENWFLLQSSIEIWITSDVIVETLGKPNHDASWQDVKSHGKFIHLSKLTVKPLEVHSNILLPEDIILRAPLHSLVSGERALAHISSGFPFLIKVFRVKCVSQHPNLELGSIIVDKDTWTVSVSNFEDKSLVVAGIRRNEFTQEPIREEQPLFSFYVKNKSTWRKKLPSQALSGNIRQGFKIHSTGDFETSNQHNQHKPSITASIYCSTEELEDIQSITHIPRENPSFPTNLSIIQSTGISTSGISKMYFRPLFERSLVTSVQNPVLFDTEPIFGNQTSTSLAVTIVDENGDGQPAAELECKPFLGFHTSYDVFKNLTSESSSNFTGQHNPVHLDKSCSVVHIHVNSTESTSSVNRITPWVTIKFRFGSLVNIAHVLIFRPKLPLTFETDGDPVLRKLVFQNTEPVFDGLNNTCNPNHHHVFSRRLLNIMATFIPYSSFSGENDDIWFKETSLKEITIDMTPLLIELVNITRPSVAQLRGRYIAGISEGSTDLIISNPLFPSVVLGNLTIYVTSAQYSLIVAINANFAQRLLLQFKSKQQEVQHFTQTSVLSRLQQDTILRSEGEKVHLYFSVNLDDGSSFPLLSKQDGLKFISYNENQMTIIDFSSAIVQTGAVNMTDSVILGALWFGSQFAMESCSPLIIGNISASIRLPDAVSINVIGSQPRLIPSYDPSANLLNSPPTSMDLKVIITFKDNQTRDITLDERLSYSLMSESDGEQSPKDTAKIEFTKNAIRVIAVGAGRANLRFNYFQNNLTYDLPVMVTSAANIMSTLRPFPTFKGSNTVTRETLYPFHRKEENGLWFQQAIIEAMIVLSDGYMFPASNDEISHTLIDSQNRSVSCNKMEVFDNIISVNRHGRCLIKSTIGNLTVIGQNITSTIFPFVDTEQLTNIFIDSGSTLRGFPGNSIAMASVTAVFSDGSTIDPVVANGEVSIPGLVSWDITPAHAASVNSSSGIIRLLDNHYDFVKLRANSMRSDGQSISTFLLFACNLDPSVGEADLGSLQSIPIPPTHAGNEFDVDLRVNLGSSVLGVFNVLVRFNQSALTFLSATQLFSGIFDQSIDSGTLSLAGVTTDSRTQGHEAKLVTIKFRADVPGIYEFSAIVLDLFDRTTPIARRIGSSTHKKPSLASKISILVKANINNKRRNLQNEHRRVKLDNTRNSNFGSKTKLMTDIEEAITLSRRNKNWSSASETLSIDANGDGEFNTADALFTLQFTVERGNDFKTFDGLLIQQIINTDVQRLEAMDANRDGVVQTNDAEFMLSVITNRRRFIGQPVIQGWSNSVCLYNISVVLADRFGSPPALTDTAVYAVIESTIKSFQKAIIERIKDLQIHQNNNFNQISETGGMAWQLMDLSNKSSSRPDSILLVPLEPLLSWRGMYIAGIPVPALPAGGLELLTTTRNNLGVSIVVLTRTGKEINGYFHKGRTAGQQDFKKVLIRGTKLGQKVITMETSNRGYNPMMFAMDHINVTRKCNQVCGSDSYQKPPTYACFNYTFCHEEQYILTKETITSDRVCANLTVCNSSQIEVLSPTFSSDRMCDTLMPISPSSSLQDTNTMISGIIGSLSGLLVVILLIALHYRRRSAIFNIECATTSKEKINTAYISEFAPAVYRPAKSQDKLSSESHLISFLSRNQEHTSIKSNSTVYMEEAHDLQESKAQPVLPMDAPMGATNDDEVPDDTNPAALARMLSHWQVSIDTAAKINPVSLQLNDNGTEANENVFTIEELSSLDDIITDPRLIKEETDISSFLERNSTI